MENNKNSFFEDIYVKYYSRMKRFALQYVLIEEDAENIVQDIFMKLWEQRDRLLCYDHLIPFLFISLKNSCIDFIRHKQFVSEAKDKMAEDYQLTLKTNYSALEEFDDGALYKENLDEIINKALSALPERCREIFIKSKIEGRKQKEIAEELNLSLNTVENQIAIAYKKLREELKDLILLLIFLFP
jgi:RNA polymerase sigma-70 factor (ECF subfamily)